MHGVELAREMFPAGLTSKQSVMLSSVFQVGRFVLRPSDQFAAALIAAFPSLRDSPGIRAVSVAADYLMKRALKISGK